MIGRIAGCVLATVLALAPVCGYARTAGPAMQIVPATQIASLAERIARGLVTDPNRALAPAFLIIDQSVPSGAVTIAAGTPQLNATYVSVPIAIDIDGKLARTVFAGFRITTYVRMAVAAHDVAPGAILDAADVTYLRMPYNGRPSLDINAFVGRKARSTIARGDVLFPELTAVNEIVRAGMPAVLIVHDGPVRLAADGVARNGGGLGDYVTIFNPQTQKALSGVVTGPNTVELTLPGEN